MALQAAEKASGGYSLSPPEAAGWAVFAIYLVLVVGFAWNISPGSWPERCLAAHTGVGAEKSN